MDAGAEVLSSRLEGGNVRDSTLSAVIQPKNNLMGIVSKQCEDLLDLKDHIMLQRAQSIATEVSMALLFDSPLITATQQVRREQEALKLALTSDEFNFSRINVNQS